jgi:geranylgeranyl diphosphate synthase type II
MGCVIGGGSQIQVDAAGRFGYHLGLAFQVVDDILDVTSTADQLGKPVGSDADNHKNTYVSLLGLADASVLAKEYTEKAKESLCVFPETRDDLISLADTLLKRVF